MYTSFIKSISNDAVIVNSTIDVQPTEDNTFISAIRDTNADSYRHCPGVTHRLVLRVEEGTGAAPYVIDIYQYSGLSKSIQWDFFTAIKFTRFHLVNRPDNCHFVEGKLYYVNEHNEENWIHILPTLPDSIFFLHKELIFPVS